MTFPRHLQGPRSPIYFDLPPLVSPSFQKKTCNPHQNAFPPQKTSCFLIKNGISAVCASQVTSRHALHTHFRYLWRWASSAISLKSLYLWGVSNTNLKTPLIRRHRLLSNGCFRFVLGLSSATLCATQAKPISLVSPRAPKPTRAQIPKQMCCPLFHIEFFKKHQNLFKAHCCSWFSSPVFSLWVWSLFSFPEPSVRGGGVGLGFRKLLHDCQNPKNIIRGEFPEAQ